MFCENVRPALVFEKKEGTQIQLNSQAKKEDVIIVLWEWDHLVIGAFSLSLKVDVTAISGYHSMFLSVLNTETFNPAW